VRGVTTSAQIAAAEHDIFCVDNNLFGVSCEVTAPGVLPFGQIFAALRAGNGARPQTPSEQFARTAARVAPSKQRQSRRRPATAAIGRGDNCR
jgi:hypothetical protein